MELTEMLKSLITTASAAELDLRKFSRGNTAAGVRARAVMQDVRSQAKGIRAEVQRIRKTRRNAEENF